MAAQLFGIFRRWFCYSELGFAVLPCDGQPSGGAFLQSSVGELGPETGVGHPTQFVVDFDHPYTFPAWG